MLSAERSSGSFTSNQEAFGEPGVGITFRVSTVYSCCLFCLVRDAYFAKPTDLHQEYTPSYLLSLVSTQVAQNP